MNKILPSAAVFLKEAFPKVFLSLNNFDSVTLPSSWLYIVERCANCALLVESTASYKARAHRWSCGSAHSAASELHHSIISYNSGPTDDGSVALSKVLHNFVEND